MPNMAPEFSSELALQVICLKRCHQFKNKSLHYKVHENKFKVFVKLNSN